MTDSAEGKICDRGFFGNFFSVNSGINAKIFFQKRDRLRYWYSIGAFNTLRANRSIRLAELASSLPDQSGDSFSSNETDSDSFMRDDDDSIPQSNPIFSTSDDPEEARLEAREFGKYLLAKSFFDCREFDRCAAVFIPITPASSVLSSLSPEAQTQTPIKATKGKGIANVESPDSMPKPHSPKLPRMSQKSLFLALYAKYMAGEKRKDEDSEMILGPVDTGAAINKELVGIGAILESWFDERISSGKYDRNEGWLEYLYGVVLKKANSEDEAKGYLIKSVRLNPYIWSAWLELHSLVPSIESLHLIIPKLPGHIMRFVFHIYASQTLSEVTADVQKLLDDLDRFFPHSAFLKTQRALLHYHIDQFQETDQLFTSILQRDPHRLDDLDHYSHALFVQDDMPKLAFLAQLATATDKFRPETCCIVGNYYSKKSEHEKAVQYFKRALQLDRSFLAAWTLMGHEYVEMKNTHAAIESYRRAVDINRQDFRAWYGLGQTYELLAMNHYALFYFQRAASLRPYDARFWQALGKCYTEIGRPEQAIKAYKRALSSGVTYIEPTSSFGSGASDYRDVALSAELLYPVAMLYEQLGDTDECARYMEMVIATEEGEDEMIDGDGPDEALGTGTTDTTSLARSWLARWAFAKGDLPRAKRLAEELCEDGKEVEDAQALIRDLTARMEKGGR
ncbi:MAG: hypothetical protein Q9212_005055 [Teloschistes hypoglaucus]